MVLGATQLSMVIDSLLRRCRTETLQDYLFRQGSSTQAGDTGTNKVCLDEFRFCSIPSAFRLRGKRAVKDSKELEDSRHQKYTQLQSIDDELTYQEVIFVNARIDCNNIAHFAPLLRFKDSSCGLRLQNSSGLRSLILNVSDECSRSRFDGCCIHTGCNLDADALSFPLQFCVCCWYVSTEQKYFYLRVL